MKKLAQALLDEYPGQDVVISKSAPSLTLIL